MSVEFTDLTSLTIGPISISPQSRPKSVTPTPYNDLTLGLHSPPGLPPSYNTATRRGGSPSSTMTIRKVDASTSTPVPLDPNSLLPSHTLHCRSSRLSRWLSDLQSSNDQDILDLSNVDPIGTRSNPYLAYPHMNLAAVRRSWEEDADSMHDYVVVDEDVAQECPIEGSLYGGLSHGSATTDIVSPQSPLRLISPPSLRHFHLSRRPASPSVRTTAVRSPSRLSMFHRPSRDDLTSGSSGQPYHSRSTSLQTSLPRNASQTFGTPRASSWRWRPSVLGHFTSPSIQDMGATSPRDSPFDRLRLRPSMSSSNTCSSTTTPTTMSVHEDGESPVPSTPPSKPASLFGSMRVRSHAEGMVSQPSFRSNGDSAPSPSLRLLYPASAPHLPERQIVSPLGSKGGTIRASFMPKMRQYQPEPVNQIFIEEPDDSQPHVLFAGKPSGTRLSLTALSTPTRQAKKRKLVVSGIALNDTRRLDAIQRWCQSFGEVDQITRMPNGDLHINFQKAEVADTVCRVRAKVHIAGAGSVHLSWITGNKRT